MAYRRVEERSPSLGYRISSDRQPGIEQANIRRRGPTGRNLADTIGRTVGRPPMPGETGRSLGPAGGPTTIRNTYPQTYQRYEDYINREMQPMQQRRPMQRDIPSGLPMRPDTDIRSNMLEIAGPGIPMRPGIGFDRMGRGLGSLDPREDYIRRQNEPDDFNPRSMMGNTYTGDPLPFAEIETSMINIQDFMDKYPDYNPYRLIKELQKRNMEFANRGGLMSLRS